MADDVSIELWMERRRLSALDKQLEQSGYCGDVEKYMQECLIALYAETVPTEVQSAIEQEITTERLDAQHRAEESRRICCVPCNRAWRGCVFQNRTKL